MYFAKHFCGLYDTKHSYGLYDADFIEYDLEQK